MDGWMRRQLKVLFLPPMSLLTAIVSLLLMYNLLLNHLLWGCSSNLCVHWLIDIPPHTHTDKSVHTWNYCTFDLRYFSNSRDICSSFWHGWLLISDIKCSLLGHFLEINVLDFQKSKYISIKINIQHFSHQNIFFPLTVKKILLWHWFSCNLQSNYYIIISVAELTYNALKVKV